MALRDQTNSMRAPQKLYDPHVSLDAQYAPLIKKGVVLHLQCSPIEFASKRAQGCRNVDLWIDGKIYPPNPVTGESPWFRNLKGFIEFCCHGESGLFGYAKALCSADVWTEERRRLLEQVLHLEGERAKLVDSNMRVEAQFKMKLTTELENLRTMHERQLMEVDASYREKVTTLESGLQDAKAIGNFLQRKLATAMRAQAWAEARARRSRDLESLAEKSGNAKKRVTKICQLLQGPTIEVDDDRMGSRKRKRSLTPATSGALARVLSRAEAHALVDIPKFSVVADQLVDNTLKKIGESIDPESMLAVCDMTGVSHRGYGEIYKTVQGRIGITNKNLRATVLPRPYKVTLQRRELNSKLRELVGDYYHINNTLQIPTSKSVLQKGKGLQYEKYILNDKNTLITDVEAVQRTIVRLYGITPKEIGNNPLVFVLKLDEAEVIRGKKFERVSITLMNRVLDPAVAKDDDKYFSVQSEQEIWPIACFQVLKESHDILKWVFDQTSLPTLIGAQEAGQQLEVEGVGSFKIQWHLTADMNTIKCIYSLKHDANATYSCMYYDQKRKKPQVVAEGTTTKMAKTQSHTWEGGLFPSGCVDRPVDGGIESRWKPVLPILLCRVHICTLHALVRITEKILHMHFMYIWNMTNVQRQQVCMENMEKTLSAAGVHGGNVSLFKDKDLSRVNNSVPIKPSLNGANALKMFQQSTWSGQDKVWKDVLRSEENTNGKGVGYTARVEMWKAWEKVVSYLTGLTLKDDQSPEDFKEKVHVWGGLYLKCFGEEHVTHYVHVLVQHAPWFSKEYGILAVWSCQGIEKSHHAAKATNQNHTQHGGTKNMTSVVIQQYEHWYQNIQHKLLGKQQHFNSMSLSPNHDEVLARFQSRSAASKMAFVVEGRLRWRQTRVRRGRVWIQREDVTEIPGDNQSRSDNEELTDVPNGRGSRT